MNFVPSRLGFPFPMVATYTSPFPEAAAGAHTTYPQSSGLGLYLQSPPHFSLGVQGVEVGGAHPGAGFPRIKIHFKIKAKPGVLSWPWIPALAVEFGG